MTDNDLINMLLAQIKFAMQLIKDKNIFDELIKIEKYLQDKKERL